MTTKLQIAGLLVAASALSTASTYAVVRYTQQPTLNRAEVKAMLADELGKQSDDLRKAIKESALGTETMQKAMVEILKSRFAQQQQAPGVPPTPDRSAQIKSNADALFKSPHEIAFGNPQGDVTMVEFFDYNCGFCKRALADKLALLQADPRLKIVIKDYPILGPASVEASQVALAARLQDSGAKFLDFHKRLMSERRADKMTALAAAAASGFDTTRIENDIASDEVKAILTENNEVARALSISGTPTYVVGDSVIVGAVGSTRLTERIKAARNDIR